eukprot:CAMPEP_0172676492 /NCGR_PEP_ID=MMETSP1074-20121228/14022_1 /TAXON_ID=2916 /ORGANISM="Ceratium fusus, Strain PA161109" /LENGTH=58 /DNA_ID=CAMNT_0013494167 /DNA_START=853 /DNA_END=1029 /DNA_ORIENTATION=+
MTGGDLLLHTAESSPRQRVGVKAFSGQKNSQVRMQLKANPAGDGTLHDILQWRAPLAD